MLAAIAVVVAAVGGSFRARLTVKQQQLVAAVDERMHTLRQHRRRSADRRGDEFRDRDAQIGEQGAVEEDIGLALAEIGRASRRARGVLEVRIAWWPCTVKIKNKNKKI